MQTTMFEALESRRLLSGVTTLGSFLGSAPAGQVISGNTIYCITLGGQSGNGRIYSLPITGGTPSVVAVFNGVDGSTPNFITISGGTLYGTASGGGPTAGSLGVVWSVPITGGTPTVLASVSGTNGDQPTGLTISGNTIYVTTFHGGPTYSSNNLGDGVIFSIPIAGGTPNVLTAFNGNNGDNPLGGLVVSGSTIYGTTPYGGIPPGIDPIASGNVFSLPITGGTPTILTTFSGNGTYPDANIVLSGNTIYGATSAGPNSTSGSQGEIFSLPVTGGTPTILGVFTGPDGADPNTGVSLVGDTLYGTTAFGGSTFVSNTNGNDGDGTVFSLPITGGTPIPIVSFTANNGQAPNRFIISGGTLYGSTAAETPSYSGTIFSLPLSTAPAISSFTVDHGTAQRSMVRTLTLAFNQPVTLGANAIILEKIVGNTTTAVSSTITTIDNGTTFLITPTDHTSGGSLIDGNYSLNILPGQIQSDANPGVTMSGSTITYHFFRLFGDSNGDGTVNLVDYRAFTTTYLKSTGGAGYDSAFDSNNDGTINLLDYRAFTANYLRTITS